jgi:hypothetical protein
MPAVGSQSSVMGTNSSGDELCVTRYPLPFGTWNVATQQQRRMIRYIMSLAD